MAADFEIRDRVLSGTIPSVFAEELYATGADDESWDALARVCLDVDAETPRPIQAKDAPLLLDSRRTLAMIDGDGDGAICLATPTRPRLQRHESREPVSPRLS